MMNGTDKPKVLVVDDDVRNLDVLDVMLAESLTVTSRSPFVRAREFPRVRLRREFDRVVDQAGDLAGVSAARLRALPSDSRVPAASGARRRGSPQQDALSTRAAQGLARPLDCQADRRTAWRDDRRGQPWRWAWRHVHRARASMPLAGRNAVAAAEPLEAAGSGAALTITA
jgi:hypothetical protein